MTTESRIATTVYLSRDQLDTLETLAKQGSRSRAALIREAVDDLFHKHAKTIAGARLFHDAGTDGPLYLVSVSKRKVPKWRAARRQRTSGE